MAFILYERQEAQKFVRVSDIELSGKRGLFAGFVRGHAPSGSSQFEWRLSEIEILTSLGKTNLQEYVLMLDLKPAQKKKVSLGRVREIRGVSQQNRTTICVSVEICMESDADDAVAAKGSFELRPEQSFEKAVEFLELNGGTVEQRWTWAPMGRLNGPVLNAPTLNFFTRPLEEPVRNENFEFDQMRLDLEKLFGRKTREPLPLPTWSIPDQLQQQLPPIEYGSRLSRILSLSRDIARRFLGYVRAYARKAA